MDEIMVFSVDDVEIHMNKSNPPQYIATATGQVSSSGWKDGKLVLSTKNAKNPPDDMIDFDFVARPPTDTSLTVMSIITGTGTVTTRDPIKGCRVHTRSNVEKGFVSDKS